MTSFLKPFFLAVTHQRSYQLYLSHSARVSHLSLYHSVSQTLFSHSVIRSMKVISSDSFIRVTFQPYRRHSESVTVNQRPFLSVSKTVDSVIFVLYYLSFLRNFTVSSCGAFLLGLVLNLIGAKHSH